MRKTKSILPEMEKQMIEFNAKQIVDAGYRVHKELGPGLLESVYPFCFMEELKIRGIKTEQEVFLQLFYRGNPINKDFRLDLLVENEIIIELKSVEILLPVHVAQVLSYLRLSNKRLGFLINFNVPVFRDGIKRYVNNY
jgi:GxxExxY protein